MPTKIKRRIRRPRKKRFRVAVQFACAAAGAPRAARLRAFASAVKLRAAITLRIVGSAEARRLNRAYRGMDYATNVLAFHSGDIVLCHPVLVREARSQRKSLEAHYAHLIIHGMLHLRGHRHDRARAARRMEQRETETLARFGYPDPYSAR